MPAAAAGLPPATGAAPAAATARAPTPDGQQPDREGSGRHRFHIRADGSGRGGRQYFETGAAQEHQQQLEEQRWRQAQQEAALEQHSLAGGPHPATAAAAGGLMAGQAALREAGGAAPLPPLPPPPSSPQPAGSDARQHAMWVIEDGSGGSRSGSMAAEASDRLPPAGGSSGGDVNGSMKKGSDAFGDAVVLIEEPTEAEMWDWGAYFGSLPKKIKGACGVGWLQGNVCGGRLQACWPWRLLHVPRPRPPPLPRCRPQAGWTRGCQGRRCVTCFGHGWALSWVRRVPLLACWPCRRQAVPAPRAARSGPALASRSAPSASASPALPQASWQCVP